MGAEGSNLRREISHPAHLHAGPLTLSSNYAGQLALILGQDGDSCSICGNHLREQVYIYQCPDPNCDFKLDVSCSSIKSVIEFSGHGHHPLCFVEKPGPGISCRSCRHGSSDGKLPIFRCAECGFSLHFLCGPLPRVVDYKGHELTLTDSLLDGADAADCLCDICKEHRDPAQCVYHSPDIRFTASVDCLLPQIKLALGGDLGEVELRTVGGCIPGKVIVKDQVGEVIQADKDESEIRDDEGVGEAASSTTAQQQGFLHGMGAESSSLPREISHPAHLHAGPLNLSSNYAGQLALILGQDGDSCSICGNHLREQVYIYQCPDPNCDFKLDVSCSSIKSVIEFSGHGHHPLCFVEKPGPGIICRSCRHGLSDGELPIFRCGECGFSLHFLCGPLPQFVDYKGYELTLTDSLLDGADAEDCWCDICEEQRDPAQCVYHSPDIRFTASIDCLLPQIKLALGGDLGEVELRTVGGYISGKVIVKDQVGEDIEADKSESEIHDDEGVGEAASSTIAQEASANSVLALIDDTTNLALTSLLTMACEQSMTEAVDPDRAMSNMCMDVLTSIFAELSKQFTEHLHLNDSKDEENFNEPSNRIYDGGAVEEAEISTRRREVLESFPLLSRQVLCSLTEEQAQELDDALNTLARRISKAKVDPDIPSLDVMQWYKEKADISHLEGDVWPMKHENVVGTEEASELPPLTFIKVMRSLTSEDNELIEDAFSKCTKGENTGSTMSILFYPYRVPPEQWDFQYSDEDFKQFKKHLDRNDLVNDSYIMGWKRYALNVVKVGENTVPSHFVPIHQELVERYGDFSVDSRLSPHGKALLFHILYTVVYSMRETQVLDITDDLLCTWQFYLRVMKNVGFNIQFALDNLENLVRAYFGLKVMKFRDETAENLGKQIEELSRQTLEKESKLRELKAIQERYRRPKEADESLVKQSLIEAAKWKWKDVGDLIL